MLVYYEHSETRNVKIFIINIRITRFGHFRFSFCSFRIWNRAEIQLFLSLLETGLSIKETVKRLLFSVSPTSFIGFRLREQNLIYRQFFQSSYFILMCYEESYDVRQMTSSGKRQCQFCWMARSRKWYLSIIRTWR